MSKVSRDKRKKNEKTPQETKVQEISTGVCQLCTFHTNKPSKCNLYKNKFVGRKQSICGRYKLDKVKLDRLQGSAE